MISQAAYFEAVREYLGAKVLRADGGKVRPEVADMNAILASRADAVAVAFSPGSTPGDRLARFELAARILALVAAEGQQVVTIEDLNSLVCEFGSIAGNWIESRMHHGEGKPE